MIDNNHTTNYVESGTVEFANTCYRGKQQGKHRRDFEKKAAPRVALPLYL